MDYSNTKQVNLKASGLAAARRHTKKNLDLLDTNLMLLQRIVTEARELGAKIILFTPPARRSYVENLDKHQLSIMKANIAKIVEKNSDVKYVDFMEDTRFLDVDFRDADHLNGEGAKKLTRFINRLIAETRLMSITYGSDSLKW